MNYKGFITTLINPPAVRIRRLASNQTISHETFTSILWDNQQYGPTTDPMWSSSVNPERITFPKDGLYLVVLNTYWVDGNDGTDRIALISLNGTASQAKSTKHSIGNAADTIASQINADKDDWVRARVLHRDGGDLDFDNIQNGMSAIWLGEKI